MFKINHFILFFGLFFMSFVSYGQGEDLLSDLQALEQPDSEPPSLESSEKANNVLDSEASSIESSEGVNNVPDSVGKSVLSVKGEGLISTPRFLSMTPVAPVISLELQTPFKTKENLKWLVQAGGGTNFSWNSSKKLYLRPYLLVDAGLRYDFQPWTVSLTLGGYLTSKTFSGEAEVERAVHPVLAHIKWALSVERQINKVYVGLTCGSFAIMYGPFLGLSVRFPLETW